MEFVAKSRLKPADISCFGYVLDATDKLHDFEN